MPAAQRPLDFLMSRPTSAPPPPCAVLTDAVWGHWDSGVNYGSRPEAASQLAEMTHPNRPFISASDGDQVLISIAVTSATIG